MNKTGPGTEPWGTPLFTYRVKHCTLPQTYSCCTNTGVPLFTNKTILTQNFILYFGWINSSDGFVNYVWIWSDVEKSALKYVAIEWFMSYISVTFHFG